MLYIFVTKIKRLCLLVGSINFYEIHRRMTEMAESSRLLVIKEKILVTEFDTFEHH